VVLSKYMIGGFAAVALGLFGFIQFQNIRIDNLKDDKAQLESNVAYLAADNAQLNLRIIQEQERSDRTQNTTDELSLSLQEIRSEPITVSCGPSVDAALDFLRNREILRALDNSQ